MITSFSKYFNICSSVVFFSFLKVQPNSSNLVYNTLLELYLNDAARQKNVEAQVEHERKALDLLKNVEV